MAKGGGHCLDRDQSREMTFSWVKSTLNFVHSALPQKEIIKSHTIYLTHGRSSELKLSQIQAQAVAHRPPFALALGYIPCRSRF